MALSALQEWLIKQGAQVRSITLAEGGPAGRYVQATEDIPAGQEVLRVPKSAMLTVEAARKSQIGRKLANADMDSPGGHYWLSAYLIAERRRKASAILPYLETLPEEFPTVPLFFPKESLPLLKGSFAARLLVKRREMLCRDLLSLRRAVPEFSDVSIKELFWARTAVITRVFGITVGGSLTEALIPMADMLNHRRPPDIDWAYEDSEGAFIMKAARNIKGGDEVCNSYGRKPNGRLLIHYGFALPSGVDDEAEVTLTLPKGAPRCAEKATALRHIGSTDGHYRISNRLRHDDTLRTFTFVRAAAATAAETTNVLNLLSRDQPITPISPRSEACALALLDRACRESLSAFESPHAEEDDILLSTEKMPVNVRNAVLVRRGEKRLLHAYRKLCSESIDLLLMPRKRFFTEAVHYQGDKLITSYLLDTALALAPRKARPPIPLSRYT